MSDLFLHRQQDIVHFGYDARQLAVCNDCDIVNKLEVLEFSKLKITGDLYNTPLIVKLARKWPVEVVTPLVCDKRIDRLDPVATISAMMGFSAAPSQGGFHLLTPKEQKIYQLSSAYVNKLSDSTLIECVQELESAMPLMRRCLAFIPEHTDKQWFFRYLLIGIIRDPRWFINIEKPDRLNRLFNYLQLKPKCMRSFIHPDRYKISMYVNLVVNSWYAPNCKFNSIVRFPFNILAKYKNFEYGLLRASQAFISYIRSVWLAELYGSASDLFSSLSSVLSAVELRGLSNHLAYSCLN